MFLARSLLRRLAPLVLALLLPAGPALADGIIKVRLYIEQGSVWDKPEGRTLIGQKVIEARRVWFANGGVKLSINAESVTVFAGAPDTPLTPQDIARYATLHKASAREIVVVFRNASVNTSRAWTEASLVQADTPVIIIGKQVLERPGTKRDLAHELGHVLLRDATHATGMSALMNITWAPDNGDQLSAAEKEKAQRYPSKK
jgi:hypothetical protein